MITRCFAAVAVAALTACGGATRRVPIEDIDDELPPWRTQGEKVRVEVAEKLLDMGNTYSALEILRTMRQEGFDTPELNLLQGRALRMEGLYGEAESLLRAADKKMRTDARPAAELCILYADAHATRDTSIIDAATTDASTSPTLLQRAVAECQRVVEKAPNSAEGWNNLGFLLLSVDRGDEALTACGRAVELDGTSALYRNNLALAQATAGRNEAAYRTYLSTLPKAQAAYNVGVALERIANRDAAIEYYGRAIAFDPQLSEAVAARDRLKTPIEASPEGVSP